MKVTYPHMGTMWISVKTLLEELGLDVIPPPPITKRTLELGVKYSPEFACLPLKINIGNYLEALELGADTIIMGGGVGPCRFGYYGEVQKEILTDLEYDFEMIILEPIQGNWREFYRSLKLLVGKISLRRIKKAWERGWAKAKALDYIDRLANKTRPYLIDRREASEVYNEALRLIEESKSIEETEKVSKMIERKFKVLDKSKDTTPLQIGIVGEIYTILEPFVSMNIEEKLGEMGVLVDRSISLTTWIEEHLYLGFYKKKERQNKLKEAAKPYLNHAVGGHGLESVGESVLYAEKNYDGIIHLAPFTCMPEIIARSLLPVVSRDHNIPILSLSLDEHTGEAGYITRLEAFVDLLSRKRKKEKIV